MIKRESFRRSSPETAEKGEAFFGKGAVAK